MAWSERQKIQWRLREISELLAETRNSQLAMAGSNRAPLRLAWMVTLTAREKARLTATYTRKTKDLNDEARAMQARLHEIYAEETR